MNKPTLLRAVIEVRQEGVNHTLRLRHLAPMSKLATGWWQRRIAKQPTSTTRCTCPHGLCVPVLLDKATLRNCACLRDVWELHNAVSLTLVPEQSSALALEDIPV